MKKKAEDTGLGTEKAPSACGVYIMKDAAGKVIYVGKAKNLRKRVKSYFKDKDGRPQIQFLLSKLRDIEYILTSSENEAFLLENNLIKKYSPRYNIQLKDDKNYLCIMVDMKKDFPRIEFVRRIQRPGAMYFGPYPSGSAIRDVIDSLLTVFPLRHCSDYGFSGRKKPCIYYGMNRCLAPCVYPEKKEQYMQALRDAVLFLKGGGSKIVKVLKERMWDAAGAQDYERAAFIRDVIQNRKGLLDVQGVSMYSAVDRDIIGSFSTGIKTNIVILFIRGGQLLHKKEFSVPSLPTLEETISRFVAEYYKLNIVPPDEIVTEIRLTGSGVMENALSAHVGKHIKLDTPRHEKIKKLMKIAVLNAANFSKPEPEGMEVLRDVLKLEKLPERIECFDVAHMYGRHAACAMTVMNAGELSKDEYRLFNFGGESFDDYRMLYEAMTRRFKHKEWPYPDILLMDGGKGQLQAAMKVLKEAGINGVLPISISKDSDISIFLPGRKNPLVLRKDNEGLKLLSLLREEAHRFANVQLRRRLRIKR